MHYRDYSEIEKLNKIWLCQTFFSFLQFLNDIYPFHSFLTWAGKKREKILKNNSKKPSPQIRFMCTSLDVRSMFISPEHLKPSQNLSARWYAIFILSQSILSPWHTFRICFLTSFCLKCLSESNFYNQEQCLPKYNDVQQSKFSPYLAPSF